MGRSVWTFDGTIGRQRRKGDSFFDRFLLFGEERGKSTHRGRPGGTRYRSCWATCWGRRPCTRTILDRSRGCRSGWGSPRRKVSSGSPSRLDLRNPRHCGSDTSRTICISVSPAPCTNTNTQHKRGIVVEKKKIKRAGTYWCETLRFGIQGEGEDEKKKKKKEERRRKAWR